MPLRVTSNWQPRKRPWGPSNRLSAGIKLVAATVALGAVYYAAHLERVPETGRLRYIDVSPAFVKRLAEEARHDTVHGLEGRLLPPEHALTLHIHRVVQRILEANSLGTIVVAPVSQRPSLAPKRAANEDSPPDTEWHLFVVNDKKVVNARASYGNIVVFTGILPIAKNEEGLAAIVSHEIGHTVARHHQEQVSSVKILLALSTLSTRVLGSDLGMSDYIASILCSPHSQVRELEADAIGLKLLSKACYDPQSALESILVNMYCNADGNLTSVMERMHKHEETRQRRSTHRFSSSHPPSHNRMMHLNGLLPEAYAVRSATHACTEVPENSASNDRA
ncbi:hypothetical protein BDW22DRAFT_1433581 [Trametopsis cervina]|nr:hypothetical protein BDW22DRAFT_1433581 [Trametopsis cervina]